MAAQAQGKKRVSIRQIAEALGVSSATVSLVLNGRARDYGLSEATEARVQLKAAEMGYSLAQSRRGSPGILIAGLAERMQVLCPPRLIVRDSTAKPPTAAK
jgi:DNA-binding LacI/PurR family transcriptional regulator